MAPLRIVRVINNGDTPFRDSCDSQPYVIQPKSESLIPYEAAVLWFGNPDSIDIDARRRDRTDEYARVRVRYGIYEHEDRLHQMPNVEVYTLEGDRIHMVKDDPEGILNNPVVSDDSTLRSVQQQLLAMQAQQQQLLEAIAKNPEAAQGILQAMQASTEDPIGHPDAQPPTLDPTITDTSGNIPDSVDAPKHPQHSQGGTGGVNIPPIAPLPRSDAPPEDAPSRVKVS